jgi:hypothetical protein
VPGSLRSTPLTFQRGNDRVYCIYGDAMALSGFYALARSRSRLMGGNWTPPRYVAAQDGLAPAPTGIQLKPFQWDEFYRSGREEPVLRHRATQVQAARRIPPRPLPAAPAISCPLPEHPCESCATATPGAVYRTLTYWPVGAPRIGICLECAAWALAAGDGHRLADTPSDAILKRPADRPAPPSDVLADPQAVSRLVQRLEGGPAQITDVAAALQDLRRAQAAPTRDMMRQTLLGHAVKSISRDGGFPRVLTHAAYRRTEVWKRRTGLRIGALRAQQDVPPLDRHSATPANAWPTLRAKRPASEPRGEGGTEKSRKLQSGRGRMDEVPRPLMTGGRKRGRSGSIEGTRAPRPQPGRSTQ